MRVAFLEVLEERLREFPGRYLPEHEVSFAPATGQLPDGVENADAIVWWSYPVDSAFLSRLPNLKLAQRLGILRSKGDATAALSKGIPVSVIPHGVSDRVALHGFALTLAVLRKLVPSHLATLAGTNPDGLPEEETGVGSPALNWARIPDIETVNDKTVGILGFGEIGACYSRMVRPFGCRVLYYKRNRLSPAQEAYFGIEYAPMDEVLRASDIVSAFIPYSEDSRKMLGARELSLMKPSSIFINCGRGNTVDEVALIDALQHNRIAGAGLDVFAVEPLPQSSPLLKLPNVVLTPHNAGSVFGWINPFERIAENLRRVQSGREVILPMQPGDPQPV